MASCSSRGVALVTGQSGFTGRYLAPLLEDAGFAVVGLSRGGKTPQGTSLAADLTDPAATRKAVEQLRPEVVVHLAGVAFAAHPGPASYEANVLGTKNLLEALARLDKAPRAVLLASSANVYGNARAAMIDESAPLAPANDYAQSKLAMEELARGFMDRLPITLVRPFNYTGVGQTPNFVLPKIVDHFRRRERVIELGNVDVFRDFSDVRTVALAYQRLALCPAPGEAVNICSGLGHSLADALRMLEDVAGYALEVRTNPALVRQGEAKRLVGSPRKLLGLVGPLPQIPLCDTLRWMHDAP